MLALHVLVIVLVLWMFPSTCEPIEGPQSQAQAQPRNLTSDSLARSGSSGRANPVKQRLVGAADLAKLQALFSHALYTQCSLSSPDDDTLLRVRTQKAEQSDDDQW